MEVDCPFESVAWDDNAEEAPTRVLVLSFGLCYCTSFCLADCSNCCFFWVSRKVRPASKPLCDKKFW